MSRERNRSIAVNPPPQNKRKECLHLLLSEQCNAPPVYQVGTGIASLCSLGPIISVASSGLAKPRRRKEGGWPTIYLHKKRIFPTPLITLYDGTKLLNRYIYVSIPLVRKICGIWNIYNEIPLPSCNIDGGPIPLPTPLPHPSPEDG